MTGELRQSGSKPWVVMAVCCGMVAAGLGLSLNAAGVFYAPVADDLGMMRGTFSLHMTVFSLVTAFTTLLVPTFMHRFPYKAILVPSLAVAVVSTFLMGRVSTPVAFYVLGAIRESSTADASFSYANPTFLCIALMGVLMAFVTSIAQNFPGYAESIGLAVGATMTSVAMVGNILMKLGIGVLSDRVGAPKATIVMCALCVAGLVLIMLGGSVPLMLAGSLLFGGSYAVGAVSASLLPRHFFGNDQFDRAYPPVAMASNVGAAVSMSAIGFVYDATQSYVLAFILCIGLGVAAIATVAAAGKLARR